VHRGAWGVWVDGMREKAAAAECVAVHGGGVLQSDEAVRRHFCGSLTLAGSNVRVPGWPGVLLPRFLMHPDQSSCLSIVQ